MARQPGTLKFDGKKYRLTSGPFYQSKEIDESIIDEAMRAAAQKATIEVSVEFDGLTPTRVAVAGATTSNVAVADRGVPGDFHNAYNFVPALPRNLAHPDLGDHAPVGHESLKPGLFTGSLKLQLTVETPLLVPDSAAAEGDDHKSFPVRVGPDGRPYLPPTTVKGALRSAYEAVTNSRFGVWQQRHSQRLAYRQDASTVALTLVPARVSDDGAKIELLMGTSTVARGNKPSAEQYAAWIPAYLPDRQQNRLGDLRHGQHVHALVRRVGTGPLLHWMVERVQSTPIRDAVVDGDRRLIEGWVCRTGHNFPKKHDERLFFSDVDDPKRVPITETRRAAWRELITNFQDTHADEVRHNVRGPSAAGGRIEWSRHVTGGEGERELAPGTLLYARMHRKDDGGLVLKGIYPVMIGRELYARSPEQLLHPSLKPASRFDEFSPADRVFGWVNASGQGGYRGQVRVGATQCLDDDAIVSFSPGLPLPILGQPKPQQFRFYVGQSPDAAPLFRGLTKADGYAPEQLLRGRKVYPHHAGLPGGYWSDPMEDRTQSAQAGRFQEYRRPKLSGQEQLDRQNRSVSGWIRPGARFSVAIDYANLSAVELGALLWLTTLPAEHFMRMGGAKPYGYGSVRVTLQEAGSAASSGEQIADDYRAFGAGGLSETLEPARFVAAFVSAVEESTSVSFEGAAFIAAYLCAATGFDDGLPVIYPRTKSGTELPPPPATGELFKWFAQNERASRGEVTLGYSLPALANDTGLPYIEEYRRGPR
ncbi:MAG: hypothetical protein FD171_861 [Actinobacteria bacterium]|nr:MAG: hypothetical protein FD171_861 [Actinomycetota bacterium]